ncbi:hypothetical protein Syun_014594 [Stephania yunnanensis]|uniref:Uncharacterized protein n=1 Tax=Stephania yunnanensis TaxID=152371 RepID=A0AAP0P9R9_9MAGN
MQCGGGNCDKKSQTSLRLDSSSIGNGRSWPIHFQCTPGYRYVMFNLCKSLSIYNELQI